MAISEKLGSALASMSDRERKLVGLTAVVAAIVLIGGVLYFGSGWIEGKERHVTSLTRELGEVRAKQAQFKAAEQKRMKSVSRLRSNNVTLFSLLQNAATDLGLQLNDLNERKVPIRDTDMERISVDVNLKQLSLDKLNAFLEKIESTRSGGLVKVLKLKVKARYDNAELLDVTMTVATWKAVSS